MIVTNAHVATTASTVSGRPQLRVQLHDSDVYQAVVRDVDRRADIATVKVNPQVRASVLETNKFMYVKSRSEHLSSHVLCLSKA